MNRKKLFVTAVFLIATAFYFVFYHKDKTLKFVPKNADVVILVDVKNVTRQYICALAFHPSQWFRGGKNKISIKKSGLKIPDFLQVFHIKDTKFSDWYSIFEIKDKQAFLSFLKQEKFVNEGENLFQKDNFFIKIEGQNCIVGTSASAFENINRLFLQFSQRTVYSADQYIDNTSGSISFISGEKIQNFSIELNHGDIEIKNSSKSIDFTSLIDMLERKVRFSDIELDAKNIKNYAGFFDKSISDSSQINYFKLTSDLEQVSYTIITYGYDDNFNEIEKKSFQKIIQPNYSISLQSSNPGKTWEYFQHKKWINAQNQFTIIPFQPNNISKIKDGFEIKSMRKPVPLSQKLNENYIFVRNNDSLLSSFNILNVAEKKIISAVDYIFYGNRGQDYYVRIKGKKGDLPLILR
ncbi:hypothetical protein ACM39_02100 [Chryseobacterium sp. FH2]|uniref:hypothetical protein n=1 Tax=Chryseobacterium sp. FH2 TaxID=1674291 RepID=UPI00065AD60A|nr:hypothetical protein [Chryseobacterium sp. FH2]KMQ69856.1 hypothetical protein ACM39_02100 [Chryseobacterium sp. FH2]